MMANNEKKKLLPLCAVWIAANTADNDEVSAILTETLREAQWESVLLQPHQTLSVDMLASYDLLLCDISALGAAAYFVLGYRSGSGLPLLLVHTDEISPADTLAEDLVKILSYPSSLRYSAVQNFKKQLLEELSALRFKENKTSKNHQTGNRKEEKQQETYFSAAASPTDDDEQQYETLPSSINQYQTENVETPLPAAVFPKGYIAPSIDDIQNEIERVEKQRHTKTSKPPATAEKTEKSNNTVVVESAALRHISNEKFKHTYNYLKMFMDEYDLSTPQDLKNRQRDIYRYFVSKNTIPSVFENLEEMQYVVDYVLAN
ncbi:MAG: hypothetical protein IPL35_03470 [Sphingobacteriales bacterium]|nr:hypothetical protein [Sphingobacteriales bacterium]